MIEDFFERVGKSYIPIIFVLLLVYVFFRTDHFEMEIGF